MLLFSLHNSLDWLLFTLRIDPGRRDISHRETLSPFVRSANQVGVARIMPMRVASTVCVLEHHAWRSDHRKQFVFAFLCGEWPNFSRPSERKEEHFLPLSSLFLVYILTFLGRCIHLRWRGLSRPLDPLMCAWLNRWNDFVGKRKKCDESGTEKIFSRFSLSATDSHRYTMCSIATQYFWIAYVALSRKKREVRKSFELVFPIFFLPWMAGSYSSCWPIIACNGHKSWS